MTFFIYKTVLKICFRIILKYSRSRTSLQNCFRRNNCSRNFSLKSLELLHKNIFQYIFRMFQINSRNLLEQFQSVDFFQNQLFLKILSGIPSECQTDWNQIRPDILSGLIWIQSVCKSYQQNKDLMQTTVENSGHIVFQLTRVDRTANFPVSSQSIFREPCLMG